MKIIIADKLAKEAVDYLKDNNNVTVITGFDKENFDLKSEILDADAVVVRSKTKITEDLINLAKNLKIIGRAGIGVDNIDVSAATKNNIYVVNSPTATTDTVADHTLAMMLALLRKIPFSDKRLRQGIWKKNDLLGRELSCLTVGIIGLGRIGLGVAKRARAFGSKIIGFDPIVPPEDAKKHNVEFVQMKRLLTESDIITLHIPLLDSTRHLLSTDAFSKMKEGVYIVNVARGGIIDEEELLKQLDCGKVSGAALDVFESEKDKNAFFDRDDVIVTPHIGASTVDAQIRAGTDVCESIINYLAKNEINNNVNKLE